MQAKTLQERDFISLIVRHHFLGFLHLDKPCKAWPVVSEIDRKQEEIIVQTSASRQGNPARSNSEFCIR